MKGREIGEAEMRRIPNEYRRGKGGRESSIVEGKAGIGKEEKITSEKKSTESRRG